MGKSVGRPPVVRMRRLTPGQEQRLALIRRLSTMLDAATVIPGTGIRIGLDPILGLVPGLGDLVSPLFTIGVIWQARDLGIPRVVLLRMVINVAIDALFGLVPVAGDLFDVAWKSNLRNVALLDRYAREEHRASRGDWVFVLAMILLLVVIAAAPFVLVGWLFGTLGASS